MANHGRVSSIILNSAHLSRASGADLDPVGLAAWRLSSTHCCDRVSSSRLQNAFTHALELTRALGSHDGVVESQIGRRSIDELRILQLSAQLAPVDGLRLGRTRRSSQVLQLRVAALVHLWRFIIEGWPFPWRGGIFHFQIILQKS